MKQNIQRVIKCLTCLVTCFVILVCSVSTPAQAAITSSDIFFLTDYVYEIVRNEDDTYVDFRIDNPDGDWLQCVNSSQVLVCTKIVIIEIHSSKYTTCRDFINHRLYF